MTGCALLLKDWNKTALIFDDAEISYSRLISNTVRFSKSYRMKKGGRAVIFSENRPEWVYAFYSVWMNGGINVPLDASLPAEDAAAMLKDCRPSIIFCSAGTRSAVSSAVRASRLKIKIIVFEKFFLDWSDDVPDGDIIGIGDADDTAVIIYTSGTTGRAKGVMLTFDNIITNVKSITDPGMITRDDRMIALLPFHHIFSLQGSVIVPLYVGATVVFVKSQSSEEILSTLQKHGVTMFLGVPRLYELFHNAIMGKIMKSLFARLLMSLARRVNSIRFSRMIFGMVHRAFAILGVELEVPVVPVAIDGAYEMFPRGSSFPRRGNISITFGRPVFPSSYGYNTLVKKVENSVKKMLKKIKRKKIWTGKSLHPSSS